MKVLALVDGLQTEVEVSVPGGGGSGVPTRVPADGVYTVPEDEQAVFMKRIKLEDGARIKAFGILVEPR